MFLPVQSGDVQKTWADTDKLCEYCNYKPNISSEEGIEEFVSWYKKYNLNASNYANRNHIASKI